MAGLLDQYTVAENKDALDMVVAMANYFNKRVNNVIKQFTIERHYKSLNEETGGMNDVLYRLYIVTVSFLVTTLELSLKLYGIFCWELVSNNFSLVVLHTMSIISLHLWCMHGESV